MTLLLEGVRQGASPSAASSRAAQTALVGKGVVTYRVVSAPAREARSRQSDADKRANARRRSPMRSAKLLDAGNRFICECLVHDRSGGGLRLQLMKNIGLPSRFRLYDDESGEIRVLAMVWRRNETVGARYCATAEPAAIKESLRAALRGRYYAVPD